MNAHTSMRLLVQARGGLVEEHHVRAPGEARGEVEPPPHASRVGLRGATGGLGQAEALEDLAAAAAGLGA
jgi:hypothetical protein